MPVIQVLYYTDPACPWSWALEPALRKLHCVFAESLRFTHVVCGMAREFSGPQTQLAESLEAGARSGLPVDLASHAIRVKLQRGQSHAVAARGGVLDGHLVSEWRLRAERLGSGELWSPG